MKSVAPATAKQTAATVYAVLRSGPSRISAMTTGTSRMPSQVMPSRMET